VVVSVAVCPLIAVIFVSGDYVHLALMYPFYAWKIHAASTDLAESVSFDWGATGFAGSGNSQRSLVYDFGDKLESKVGERPLQDMPDAKIDTIHLIGKFYVTELSW
jgi:hypothetical protein